MTIEGSITKSYLKKLITVIAVITSFYQMIASKWLILPIDQHKVLFVGVGLILVFLLSMEVKEKKNAVLNRLFTILLVILSSLFTLYLILNYHEIVTRMGINSLRDTIVGAFLVLLVLEATRRSWGLIIPSIVVVALAYGYFGQYMPGILFHGGMSFNRLVSYASINFQGIYGSLTSLGAMEVFMFVLFGSTLQASGGTNFFMKLALGIGSRYRSGAAQASVISSGLLGSVSGSIATNVATTGTITIPLMTKRGYSKEYAGAVEAVASTGGQIMPPVMGAAAFIMANTTGIPYVQILMYALLPALLYYLSLSISIQIRSVKLNLPVSKDKDNQTLVALKEDGYLMLSLGVLIWALAARAPVQLAALYAILTLMVLFIIKQSIVYRSNPKKFFTVVKNFFIESLSSGAISGVKLGLILASLGIMVEFFVVTGFAQKISFQMIELSGESLPLLLLLVAVTCLLFGLGMPTTGAYLVVSILAAPALVKFGIPIIAAHLYVFYFGLMASVTPPVGIGAIVASSVSGGNYMKTALISSRLALPGFLLPVFFIYRPELIWLEGNFFDTMLAFISTLIGLVSIGAIFERFLVNKLKVWQILLLVISTLLSFHSGMVTSLIGIILFAFVVFLQSKGRHKDSLVQKMAG
jgi:TRAP transporter 4TM/12TM fusion protein